MKHQFFPIVRIVAIWVIIYVCHSVLGAQTMKNRMAIVDECFFTGSARIEHDSNIYGNDSEVSDTIYRLIPGVAWAHDSGLLRANATAGVEFQRFAEHTAANSNNPYVTTMFNWPREEGKSEGGLSASWRRVASANEMVNQRTRSNNTNVDAAFGHFVTEKIGYRLLGSFLDHHYLTTGYSSIRNWSVGIEGRYQYSPKLEAILGYSFRQSATRDRNPALPNVDSKDHKVLAGLDGELLPKVKGRLAAGVVTREYTSGFGHRETALLLETAVDWTPDDDTTITLLGRRDFDTSPADQSVRRLLTDLGVRRIVSEKLEVSGGIGFEKATYTGGFAGRDDDTLHLRARATYQFTRLISGGCDIAYRNTRSSLTIAQCSQVLVGASVGLKF